MRRDQRDPYATTLRATVTGVERDRDAVWVTLSDSLVYPTSGGQPHDRATMTHPGGRAEVVDAVLPAGAEATPDGAPSPVRHRIDGPPPREGDPVDLALDVERRRRHMERHSAQHLLSQALLRQDPAFTTEAVSLASADATIDVAGGPDDAQLRAALDLARSYARANLEVTPFEVDDADLAAYPLRRTPKVRGTVRLVRMGDVELAACGGTHVARTAEVLPLLARPAQRVKGGLVRLTFRAGRDATDLAQATLDDAHALARTFSAAPADLPDRVAGLRAEAKAAADAADAARRDWAAAAAHAGTDRLGVRRDASASSEADAKAHLEALRTAAAATAPAGLLRLAVASPERVHLLLTRGPDAPEVDLRPAFEAAMAQLGGRGGGPPHRVQGAAPAATLDTALDTALTTALDTVDAVLNGDRDDAPG